MMKDGIFSAFSEEYDESAMYVNIYGKTIQDLINEGKELMKENESTIDEFKENLENLEDTNSISE